MKPFFPVSGDWTFIVNGRKRSYVLHAKLQEEAIRWANEIQEVIYKILQLIFRNSKCLIHNYILVSGGWYLFSWILPSRSPSWGYPKRLIHVYVFSTGFECEAREIKYPLCHCWDFRAIVISWTNSNLLLFYHHQVATLGSWLLASSRPRGCCK